MKKTVSILICLLFALTILYPAGVIITACFGYSFELISISAFAIAIAALSVCALVLDIMCKSSIENKVVRVLLVFIVPLSLINALFYIVKCPKVWVIASVLISVGCCIFLAIKRGKPLWLKIMTLILSALIIFPISFFGFIALLIGNFVENTVVQTVDSPNGKYYAQVISSDQGALGGDTLVDVYKKSGIDLIFIKIEKIPQQVYLGNWGEFENMQIYWKDDTCLVINSTEYEIE